MFESRPIWSRNAVKANINIQPDKLKLLLPVVAYYMVSREVEDADCKIIDYNIPSATKLNSDPGIQRHFTHTEN